MRSSMRMSWRRWRQPPKKQVKKPNWTHRPDFDVQGITYQDIDAPVVWKGGSYLCKVILAIPWKKKEGDFFNNYWSEFAAQGLPASGFRKVSNGWENYVLFEDEDDAKRFVAFFLTPSQTTVDKKSLILKVARPESLAAANAMKADKRIRIRNNLYFQKFGYVVRMAPRLRSDTDIMEGRLTELFGGNSACFRITHGASVRVYLTQERQIVPVRLAFGEAITRIERVLLRGTFENNAHGTCEGACRQGSDPPRN